MLKELKTILNSYTDDEIDRTRLWGNGIDCVQKIIVAENSLDLITEEAEIKIVVDDQEYID